MTPQELKTCPFCGPKDAPLEQMVGPETGRNLVRCILHTSMMPEDEWNTRPTPPSSELVKQARGLDVKRKQSAPLVVAMSDTYQLADLAPQLADALDAAEAKLEAVTRSNADLELWVKNHVQEVGEKQKHIWELVESVAELTDKLEAARVAISHQRNEWACELVRRRMCDAGPIELENIQTRITECDSVLAALKQP